MNADYVACKGRLQAAARLCRWYQGSTSPIAQNERESTVRLTQQSQGLLHEGRHVWRTQARPSMRKMLARTRGVTTYGSATNNTTATSWGLKPVTLCSTSQ